MSCDWLTHLPAILMLAGWVLLPLGILLVRTGVNRHRRARTMLLRANDRLEAAGRMVIAIEQHLPYPPELHFVERPRRPIGRVFFDPRRMRIVDPNDPKGGNEDGEAPEQR